jgi:heparanase
VPLLAALMYLSGAQAETVHLTPAALNRAGEVDDRYQSYNIEMLEVTGGRFWRPYGPELDAALKPPRAAPAASSGDTPSGMNPALYEYRRPIDLTNTRLRKLAAALGPAYVRASGTWANTTYFAETGQAPANPPPGFGGVLTHAQWRGFIDFSKAVDARIVTSFATGVGTRDSSGRWAPDLAKRWLDFTRLAGGRIAAAEWMNEPTLAVMGGAPKGYDAAAYGRDFKTFHAFAKQAVGYSDTSMLTARDMLAASQPAQVDGFSYHHYGAVSLRCAATGPRTQTSPEAALTEDWLGRTDQTLAFYRRARDEFEPGKPFWNTETADAACGGNPAANTFLDTFRYLDQLGRLAKQEVRVVAHNTLVASDYGLLNDKTFEPKPNYWGALLWRQLMGTTVLDSGIPIREGLHVYTHCLRGTPGGVAMLAINNSRTQPTTITVLGEGKRYTMTAPRPEAATVQLNGQELRLDGNDELPRFQGRPTLPGSIEFPPASITFLSIAGAGNGNCR